MKPATALPRTLRVPIQPLAAKRETTMTRVTDERPGMQTSQPKVLAVSLGTFNRKTEDRTEPNRTETEMSVFRFGFGFEICELRFSAR
jgi:hypothetical protein